MARTEFEDRRDAGRRLARLLEGYRKAPGLIVLGLPRGGIPVAYEVARHLDAPLAPFIVRKLGVPGREEVAMGAVASGGIRVFDRDLIERLGIGPAGMMAVIRHEEREIERRERLYAADHPLPSLRGRTVLLVDDGIATGASLIAALEALRQQEPASVIVAVPISSAHTAAALREAEQDIVCVIETPRLNGVGRWYRDFRQTSDAEVRALLAAARPETAGVNPP